MDDDWALGTDSGGQSDEASDDDADSLYDTVENGDGVSKPAPSPRVEADQSDDVRHQPLSHDRRSAASAESVKSCVDGGTDDVLRSGPVGTPTRHGSPPLAAPASARTVDRTFFSAAYSGGDEGGDV